MQNINRISLIVIAIFLCSIIQHAQVLHTGYVTPEIVMSQLDGRTAVFAGGKAMWVFNNKFGIGGSYYATVSRPESDNFDAANNAKSITEMSFGGLHFEYFLPSNSSLQHSLELVCAGGGLKLLPRYPDKNHTAYYGSDLLMWIPKYNAMLRLNEAWRVAVGIGYQHVTNFNGYFNFTPQNISGFNLCIGLRWGNN